MSRALNSYAAEGCAARHRLWHGIPPAVLRSGAIRTEKMSARRRRMTLKTYHGNSIEGLLSAPVTLRTFDAILNHVRHLAGSQGSSGLTGIRRNNSSGPALAMLLAREWLRVKQRAARCIAVDGLGKPGLFINASGPRIVFLYFQCRFMSILHFVVGRPVAGTIHGELAGVDLQRFSKVDRRRHCVKWRHRHCPPRLAAARRGC